MLPKVLMKELTAWLIRVLLGYLGKVCHWMVILYLKVLVSVTRKMSWSWAIGPMYVRLRCVQMVVNALQVDGCSGPCAVASELLQSFTRLLLKTTSPFATPIHARLSRLSILDRGGFALNRCPATVLWSKR